MIVLGNGFRPACRRQTSSLLRLGDWHRLPFSYSGVGDPMPDNFATLPSGLGFEASTVGAGCILLCCSDPLKSEHDSLLAPPDRYIGCHEQPDATEMRRLPPI
jgi:hypothetical protein